MYPATTSCRSAPLACRSVPMRGAATLAMATSRIAMNTPVSTMASSPWDAVSTGTAPVDAAVVSVMDVRSPVGLLGKRVETLFRVRRQDVLAVALDPLVQ